MSVHSEASPVHDEVVTRYQRADERRVIGSTPVSMTATTPPRADGRVAGGKADRRRRRLVDVAHPHLVVEVGGQRGVGNARRGSRRPNRLSERATSASRMIEFGSNVTISGSPPMSAPGSARKRRWSFGFHSGATAKPWVTTKRS